LTKNPKFALKIPECPKSNYLAKLSLKIGPDEGNTIFLKIFLHISQEKNFIPEQNIYCWPTFNVQCLVASASEFSLDFTNRFNDSSC